MVIGAACIVVMSLRGRAEPVAGSAPGPPCSEVEFRISDMGPDGTHLFEARFPVVTWNVQQDEYLVVWDGNDDTPPLAWGGDPGPDDLEIYAQRLCSPDPVADGVARILDLLELLGTRGIDRGTEGALDDHSILKLPGE